MASKSTTAAKYVMLLSWGCPLGHGKWHLPAIQFILTVRLIPILTHLSSRWTVPLRHTAKIQYQKFETNIHRKGIVRSQSQFPHSCVCERFIFSQDRFAYSATGNMRTYPGNIYVNLSQTHECGNLDWGRTFSFLGIHNGIFVAVQWSNPRLDVQ
jgi:hypothetical protein